MTNKDENIQKIHCIEQLFQIREFYDMLSLTIITDLQLTRRTYNRKLQNNSFSVAEQKMIEEITTNKLEELCK